MKIFKKSLLIYLLLGILGTYALGWIDLVNNNWLTGNVLKDLYKSITYYFGWVLIYWWIFILVGGLFLAAVTAIAYNLYLRFKRKGVNNNTV